MVRAEPRGLRRRDGESLRSVRRTGRVEPLSGSAPLGPLDDYQVGDPAAWRARLGMQVSVRFRTGDEEHPHGSNAGLLQAVEEDTDGASWLVLLTRGGRERRVEVSSIVVGKTF